MVSGFQVIHSTTPPVNLQWFRVAAGQRKLQQAAVVVLGAGGLGCSAIQHLAAAGVGAPLTDFNAERMAHFLRRPDSYRRP